MNPIDGTFANNALKHKVAGLNIDGCRIPTTDNLDGGGYDPEYKSQKDLSQATSYATKVMNKEFVQPQGRFPSNFIHDGSQQVMDLFPDSKDGQAVNHNRKPELFNQIYGKGRRNDGIDVGYGDSGSAARYFYCAKASRSERNKGCEDMYWLEGEQMTREAWTVLNEENEINKDNKDFKKHRIAQGNTHPTVKSLALLTYLCKLVKYPEYNLIIDPFMGSGTTLLACIRLGIPCIGIDSDETSCRIAMNRCQQEIKELNI